MTLLDPFGDEQELDVGLGMDVDVDVDVRDEERPADADTAPDSSADTDDPALSYLLKFDPDVTPAAAEAVLGRLSPPDEGIILAGHGAVIVRAQRAFVDFAKRQDCVALVNGVRTQQWEPNRHQVRANTD